MGGRVLLGLLGFMMIHDGSCLLLLLASIAILLVVYYRTDTCLAASIIYLDPVSKSSLNQRFARS